jgi:predicted Zn-dependent peptidase
MIQRSNVVLVAAALLIAVPDARGGDLSRVRIPFVQRRLANGLTVLVDEDHSVPRVSVDVWYDVGSKDDPPNRSGFAHLFEHLMLQGSRHVPEDMAFKLLEQAGATDRNGMTNEYMTRYFETVPSNELELALWIESDRMGFFVDHLNKSSFDNQRDVVKNERRQRYEDRPCGFCWKILNEHLFPPGHPYHRPAIGDPRDLDAASLDEVRTFFRTFYVPNNATLVVAGDVDADVALALVDKYFGPIVPRPVPGRSEPPAIVLDREIRIEVTAGVDLAEIFVGWPSPAAFHDGDSDLDLLVSVLTTGESSRLYRLLVHDLGVAQSVRAYQNSSKFVSDFVIDVRLRPGHTPDEVLRRVDEALSDVRARGIPHDELERARAEVLTANVCSLERTLDRAERLQLYQAMTGNANSIERDFARYQEVTVDSVRRAALKYLTPGRRVVEFVRPTPGAPLAGEVRAGDL